MVSREDGINNNINIILFQKILEYLISIVPLLRYLCQMDFNDKKIHSLVFG